MVDRAQKLARELIIFGKRDPDPFHRVLLSAFEFQIVPAKVVGPQTLAVIPEGIAEKNHLDLDAVAVWLMSAEMNGGSVLSIYNQQMGLYALSYHVVVHDIRARAFQRPLCLALLQPSRPTPSTFERFVQVTRKAAASLLLCNRRLFLRQLQAAVNLADEVEADQVSNYYALHFEGHPELSKTRLKAVADQARKIRSRATAFSEAVRRSLWAREEECEGHEEQDINDEEIELGVFALPTASTPLLPLDKLAPCTYTSFITSLPILLERLTTEEPRKGVIYSADEPILQLPKYETPLKSRCSALMYPVEEGAHDEDTLKSVSTHFDQLLYPVLAGDGLVVCGGEQRRAAVVDLVGKLNAIKPRAHSQPERCVLWSEGCNDPSLGGLVWGECLSRAESRVRPRHAGVAILDANNSELRLSGVYGGKPGANLFQPNIGRLLSPLATRRHFPSDRALLAFVAALLSADAAAVAYLTRLMPQPFKRLPKGDQLHSDDERLIAALLCEFDFVRFHKLKTDLEKRRKATPTKVLQL